MLSCDYSVKVKLLVKEFTFLFMAFSLSLYNSDIYKHKGSYQQDLEDVLASKVATDS